MTNVTPPDPQYSPPPANTQPPAPNAAPAYPGAAYQGAAPAQVPGRGLAIAGLVLAFLMPLVGLILSIIAAVKLGKAGAPKGMAIAGIIISAVLLVLGVILAIVLFAAVFNSMATICSELGPGVWEVGGVTYTCN